MYFLFVKLNVYFSFSLNGRKQGKEGQDVEMLKVFTSKVSFCVLKNSASVGVVEMLL